MITSTSIITYWWDLGYLLISWSCDSMHTPSHLTQQTLKMLPCLYSDLQRAKNTAQLRRDNSAIHSNSAVYSLIYAHSITPIPYQTSSCWGGEKGIKRNTKKAHLGKAILAPGHNCSSSHYFWTQGRTKGVQKPLFPLPITLTVSWMITNSVLFLSEVPYLSKKFWFSSTSSYFKCFQSQ